MSSKLEDVAVDGSYLSVEDGVTEVVFLVANICFTVGIGCKLECGQQRHPNCPRSKQNDISAIIN